MATDWTAFEAVQDTPTNAPINWGDFEPENAAEKARLGAEMRSLRRQRMLGDAAEGFLGGAEAATGVVARMNPVTAVANAADALGIQSPIPAAHVKQAIRGVSDLTNSIQPQSGIPDNAPLVGSTGNPNEDRAIEEGILDSVSEQVSGLFRPDNLALMAAGIKAPVPVARAFQFGSIAALPEAIQNVQQASERGDVGGTAKAITGLTATAAIPALIEHGIPRTEIPVLPERVVRPPVTTEVTSERAPIPVPKKLSAIPEVPSTPPEPMKGVSVIEEIRNANAQTKEAIRALYPQISREEAAALRKQAWGETTAPIPEPKASEVSPAPERVQPTGEPEITAPKKAGGQLSAAEQEEMRRQIESEHEDESQPQAGQVTSREIKPLKTGEVPTPHDLHGASLEEFMAFHDSMKAAGEQRAAVNELGKSLSDQGIADAEHFAQLSRDKAKAIINGEGDLETRFKQSMQENQRTQFLDEAARTAKARKAVSEGSTPAEAIKKFGVPPSAVEDLVTKPVEPVAPATPATPEVKLGVWPESEWSAASLAKQEPAARIQKAKFLGLRDKDGQPISGPKTLADAAKKRIEEIKAAAAKPKAEPVPEPVAPNKREVREAILLKGQEPPVAEGYVRLYRGEDSTPGNRAPASEEPGRFWSTARSEAETYGDRLLYTDVPKSEIGETKETIIRSKKPIGGKLLEPGYHDLGDTDAQRQAAWSAIEGGNHAEAARLLEGQIIPQQSVLHEIVNKWDKRDWSKLPADFLQDAIKKAKEELKSYFSGGESNAISGRSKLAKARTFDEVRAAIDTLKAQKPEQQTLPQVGQPLIDVPRGTKPLQARRAQLVRMLEELTDIDPVSGKMVEKEGLTDNEARNIPVLQKALKDVETQLQTTQPKETNARPQRKNEAVHGDLRTQPESSQGQVPAKEGERRVQPQTSGGLREPAQPARAEENKVALNEAELGPEDHQTSGPEVVAEVRKNEGDAAANTVKALHDLGISTIDTHGGNGKPFSIRLEPPWDLIPFETRQALMRIGKVEVSDQMVVDAENPVGNASIDFEGDASKELNKLKPVSISPSTEPQPATKAPESPTNAPEAPTSAPKAPSKSNLPTDMAKLRKLHNSLKQEMTDLELKFPPKGQAIPDDLQEKHNAVKQKFNEVHSEIVDRLWSEEKARMTPEPPPSEPKITNKVLKAQKENLLEQVDKAIQEAPDHGPGKITISVPGDGDFTIRNVKPNLKAFRDQAAKEFPATVGKMTEPGLASGKAKPIPKATKAPSIDETIKAAAKFVSNDPTREAIHTVFSNGSQMVATDGRQLIRIWTDKAPGTPEKPVRLNEAGKPVDTDSNFPNYNAVIDPNPSLVLGGMETDQLWKLARQAQVFKNTYDNPTLGLDLVLNPDRTLGARMEQKDGDVFEHNVQKGALNLGTYQADFLVDQMDAARKLGNEKVDVYFHNDGTEGPIGFVGHNHESIMMPMRGAVDEKGEYPDLHAKASDFPANLVGARAHPRPTREVPAPKGKKAKGASVNISPGEGPKAGITPDPGLTGAIGDLIQAAGEIGGQIGGGGAHAALMPATQFGNGTLGIGNIWRNAPAKLKSLWGGFAMHELPDITRSDRPTGEAGVRYAASPLVARTKGTMFAGKVLEGLKPEMDLKLGVALSEDNLRSIRKGYEDEAKQALAEGGILKAQKAQENADNVTTLVGQKNSPFKTEKEYQAFLKSPEAQTAIARHNALWEAEKDPLYRQANDLDPDLELETRGEQTGARVNLKHVMPGEATKTTVGRLAKSTLIKQTATLLRRDPFAIRAKGSGTSYEGSYTELMAHGFEREYPVAMQHEFIRSLIEAGDAVLTTREYPKGLEIKGEPTKAYLMKLKPFEGRFLQVRKSLAPEYQAVTGLDPALRLPIYSKVADFLTRQSVQGIAEGSNHIANIFTQAFTGLGPTSNPLLNSLIKVTGRPDVLWTLPKIAIKAFTDQRQRMLDLATIGATKEGFKGALGLGRLINRVDQGVRLVTDDVFKGMAKEGWVENTETERRHMVNQVGQYAKRLQPTIIRALRDTGINPFATATHTFMLQGVRELTLNPGVKAPTIAAAAALRAEKAAGWIGLIVAVGAMNYLVSGKVMGPKGTKLLSVGWKDKDGKLQTFDVGKLTGYGRALDRTGIGPAIEAHRQGLAPNTQIKKGIQAVGNTGVSYLAGPLNRFADVAITGSRPGVPQVQEAPLMPPRDDFAPLKSQTAANIKTALLQANPLIDAATSSAQGKESKEVVAKQLSRYVPKSGLNERTIAALPKIVKAGEMNDYVDGLAKQLRKLPREQRWMQAQKTLADSEMAAADRSRALQLLKRKRIFSFE